MSLLLSVKSDMRKGVNYLVNMACFIQQLICAVVWKYNATCNKQML